jgi:hypothetical protein
MNRRLLIAVFALSTLGWGCSAFEDPTPDNIAFSLRGETGREVQLVFSSQFIATVDEFGVTGIRVFASDTILRSIPVDTVVNISVDRRFFIEILPVDADSISVDVIVDVDNRNLVAESGGILAVDPWRFVYQFNVRLTRQVEVII